MTQEQLYIAGGGLLTLLMGALGKLAMNQEAKKPASPPPERVPTENEIRSLLNDIRADFAKLHAKVDRHGEINEDEWKNIGRQLDRIEAAQRLETAMAQFHRSKDP